MIDGEGEKGRLRAGEAITPRRYKKHTTKNMETDTHTIEQLIDNPPKGCESIATLYSWAGNYDRSQGNPFQLFLDLIGFNQHWYGMQMMEGKDPSSVIGYMEAGQLGEALIAYADRPSEVTEYINSLIHAETQD